MGTKVEQRFISGAPPAKAAAPTQPIERPSRLPHISLSGLKRGFHALEVRNYRLFWIGQLISLTGSWMQTTAQAWIVIQLTQSPFSLGLVTAFQFLPILLLSLFGGVISDRLSKHKMLIITNSLLMVQAATFGTLIATGAIQLWHIYILAAFQGVVNAISNPTRQAFVSELTGKEHLVNAVALNSMLFNGARIIGPAIAGVLIAQIGTAPALFCDAVSFVAVIIGLFMMRPADFFLAPPKPQEPVLSQLAEGLRYVFHTPAVLMILIAVAAIGTFGYNFTVVLPLVAGFLLKTGAEGFGGLSAFLGVGSLIAAVTTAYSRQATLRRLMLGALAFSLLLAALGLSGNYFLSAALLIALGFAGITFTTSANTTLQLTVPDELRGRVLSLYILLFAGTTPIGGFLIGTLSDNIGVAWALVICAVLCLLGIGGAVLYQRRAAGPEQETAI